MNEIIFFIIILICLIGVIAIFIMSATKLAGQLKMVKVATINVACAGSVTNNTPSVIRVSNVANQEFVDQNGNLIDLSKFNLFWAKGWSMLLCGIQNDDLLLTKPISSLDDISFDRPHVLVLKRDSQSRKDAEIRNDWAKFKIRRTWAYVHIGEDDISQCVLSILQSIEFRTLKEKYPQSFLSDEEMIDDFENERLTRYMTQYPNSEKVSDTNHLAIISTTLRTSKGNRVFFSIHPARIIVGEVIYSFHK